MNSTLNILEKLPEDDEKNNEKYYIPTRAFIIALVIILLILLIACIFTRIYCKSRKHEKVNRSHVPYLIS